MYVEGLSLYPAITCSITFSFPSLTLPSLTPRSLAPSLPLSLPSFPPSLPSLPPSLPPSLSGCIMLDLEGEDFITIAKQIASCLEQSGQLPSDCVEPLLQVLCKKHKHKHEVTLWEQLKKSATRQGRRGLWVWSASYYTVTVVPIFCLLATYNCSCLKGVINYGSYGNVQNASCL